MESLPLATGPKHVPDGVGDRPLGGSGPAAFGAFRVPWLGQVFLGFPPQRPGHPEVVRFRLCGSLSHRAHLLSRRVMVAIPFSEGCVFVQGSQGSSRIESKGTHPKIVQEMLGHANISMTMDIYSHVLPDMQEKAVSAMDDALS